MQSKEKVRCLLIVSGWRVEGEMHVVSDSRLTDTLNSGARDFFALTNATIYDVATGKVLYRPEYLAVNRSAVSLVFPVE